MCSKLVIILNHKSFVSSEHRIYRELIVVFLHNVQHKGFKIRKLYVKIPYEPFVGYSTSYKVPTLFVDV